MKHFFTLAVALLLLPLAVTAQVSPEDRYIAIYDVIQQADTLGESGNPQSALPKYQEAQSALKKFQSEFPTWNSKIVNFRLNYLASKIGPLGSKPAVEPTVEAAAALKPSPAPPTANLDGQIKTLQEQLRQAQAEKAELEKRVQEAGQNARAASEASQALTEAQEKIKALQRDNERLKTDLKQQQAKPAPRDDTELMDRASRALADAKSKLAEQTKAVAVLIQEKAGLQQRLEALAASPAGSPQLAALQQQLREIEAEKIALQNRLKESDARAAGNADQLAKLDEKIKNLQKENSLLRASLEQRPAPTISTGDSFAAEQNKQALAEASRKLEEQAAQIAALKAEREEFKKRLDAIAGMDSIVKELASTKKELATLKRRFGVQTEAAVILLSEANIKIKQQGKASENMTRQMADLRKQMATGNTNAQLILVLREENEMLKKQIAEIRARDAANASKSTEASVELLAAQSQAATLRARLNVLEAKSIPYTAEELALFNKPEIPAATATPDSKTPPSLAHGAPELIADAQRLFASHRLEEAEAKYQEVLKLDPKNVYTLANLATIQIERENFTAAEKNLKQALKLDPNDAFSLGVRGNMLFRQGKIDEALDSLGRAAQLDPNSAEIQNVLGITLSHKGQRGAAETALRKALQLDPNYGNAHNNLAVIYITQEPPLTELARWHYQKALTLGIGRNPDLEKLLETTAPDNKSGGDKK